MITFFAVLLAILIVMALAVVGFYIIDTFVATTKLFTFEQYGYKFKIVRIEDNYYIRQKICKFLWSYVVDIDPITLAKQENTSQYIIGLIDEHYPVEKVLWENLDKEVEILKKDLEDLDEQLRYEFMTKEEKEKILHERDEYNDERPHLDKFK